MAIISSYPITGAMQDNDSWIGTDFATKQTKQYTADALTDYINANNKIFIGVESINGGSGVTVTGTVGTPIVSLDYSSSGDNLIQAAAESVSTTGFGEYSPYILMNESYPGITDATVKKIRLDNISLDRFGAAMRGVNMNGQVISNLGTPISTNDAVNKTYVDTALTAYVQSITGGSGMSITGTTAVPIASVDYSAGADNLIQSANGTNIVGGSWTTSPYVLMSESNSSDPYGEVKKIRIGEIPLNRIGAPHGDLYVNNKQIKQLQNPTTYDDAANKAYVDAAVVGGLFYQGGYDASTNTPDIITQPNDIRKGWTYTVTVDGNSFGEQLRVGDVLIAEVDSPYAYNLWTIVQNNVDLASDIQVGIGNVLAGDAINVSYSSGSATTSVDYSAGASNLVQSAATTTSTSGSLGSSPYILISNDNSFESNGEVKKIRIGDVPLNTIGLPLGDVSAGSKKIVNLDNPTNALDAVNKTYVDTALTGYVQSVTGGDGLSTTGSSATPTVAVDYSAGASNIIQSAAATTTFGGDWTTTPYILISDSNSSVSNGEAKKIRIGDVPLDLIGTPTSDVFMQNHKIVNLATPTSSNDAVTKAYVDSAVVGGLFYQGGYDASTNTPNITSLPNNILKGWTYTVTVDGNSFGEQLRVGDVLIAETNSPSGLSSWTIVQNNVDLSSSTQVGIGNVVAGTNMSVSYSNGTATLNNTFTNPVNSVVGAISAGSTSTSIVHNFGTTNVIVQAYKASGETVFVEVDRANNNTVNASIGSAMGTGINVIVYKVT